MNETEVAEIETEETTTSEEIVEQESSPEADEAKKQSKRDRGAEARIAQLTAKMKSELEARDLEIANLKSHIQPQAKDEEPIETVDDLMKVMREEMRKEFKVMLQTETQEVEKTRQEQTVKQKTESFASQLLEVYADDFDGELFVGDEKAKQELQTMMQVFQSNPTFWAEKIEKRGVSYMRDIISDADKTSQKKEVAKKILETAEKAKITKSSGNNIFDTSGQKYSTANALIKAFINKGGNK